MCGERYLQIAAIASVMTLATSRSAVQSDVPKFELRDVVHHTVCPMKVVIHDDPRRTPRRIKYIMCEDDPARRCPLADVPQTCCHYRHNHLGYITECVEIYDSIEVKYSNKDATNSTESIVKVPVGCGCMVRTNKKATEV